jgi:leucyl-tRNA synthetase
LPEKILTPLILGKEGNKMSKSDKSGIFLSYLRKAYGARYLEKVIRMADYYLNKKKELISLEEIKKSLNQD